MAAADPNELREVRITYKWPDGAAIYITIPAESMYPQALDQAAATALRTFNGALAIIAANSDEDIDADEDQDTV